MSETLDKALAIQKKLEAKISQLQFTASAENSITNPSSLFTTPPRNTKHFKTELQELEATNKKLTQAIETVQEEERKKTSLTSTTTTSSSLVVQSTAVPNLLRLITKAESLVGETHAQISTRKDEECISTSNQSTQKTPASIQKSTKKLQQTLKAYHTEADHSIAQHYKVMDHKEDPRAMLICDIADTPVVHVNTSNQIVTLMQDTGNVEKNAKLMVAGVIANHPDTTDYSTRDIIIHTNCSKELEQAIRAEAIKQGFGVKHQKVDAPVTPRLTSSTTDDADTSTSFSPGF